MTARFDLARGGCSILSWYGGPAADDRSGLPVAGEREHGWAAWLMCARDYLGYTREQMAAQIGVRADTYKAWEAGRDPIPVGILGEVRATLERFHPDRVDEAVDALVAAPADRGVVRVWRGESADAPFPPGLWRRIVATAMVIDPDLKPMFPEDIPGKGD